MFPVKQEEIFWCMKFAKVRVRRSIKLWTFVVHEAEKQKMMKNSLWFDWVALMSLSASQQGGPFAMLTSCFSPNFTFCFFPCPKQQNIWFCILFFCRVRNCCRISNTQADKNSSHQHFWLSEIARKKLYKMKKAAVNGGIERCAAYRSMAMHWICEWI